MNREIKKLATTLIATTALFGLAGCGNTEDAPQESRTPAETPHTYEQEAHAPTVSEPPPPLFAAALREYFAGGMTLEERRAYEAHSPHSPLPITTAILVDIDGNGTPGMLAVRTILLGGNLNFPFREVRVFVLYNGEISYFDDQGEYATDLWITEEGLLVDSMHHWGSRSYTLFEIDNGSPARSFTIHVMLNEDITGEANEYSYLPGGIWENARTITQQEFEDIRARHGLYSLRHWAGMADDTAKILAMGQTQGGRAETAAGIIVTGDLILRIPGPHGHWTTNTFRTGEGVPGFFIENEAELLDMLAAGFYYAESGSARLYYGLEIRLTGIAESGGFWDPDTATIAEIITQSPDATYIVSERKHSAPPIHVHTGTSARLMASFDSVYRFTHVEFELSEWHRPNNLVFWTDATVRDFSFITLSSDYNDEGVFYSPRDVLFTIPQFSPGDAFALDAAFAHYLFARGGIAFTDENGERHYMALFENMADHGPPFFLWRFEPLEE